MALVLDGSAGISGVDGTASNPAIEGTDSNTGIFYPAADTVAIGTGGTEALRVNSAQNIGFGVTPSAWGAGWKAIDMGSAGVASSGIQLQATSNAFSNNSNWIYKTTNSASMYQQINGAHSWFNAPSGTAGNPITFTQAMTLDASGRLGVGTTTPNAVGASWKGLSVGVAGIQGGGTATFGSNLQTNSYYNGSNWIRVETGGTAHMEFDGTGFKWFSDGSGSAGIFTPTERARITSGGIMGVGLTNPQDYLNAGFVTTAAVVSANAYATTSLINANLYNSAFYKALVSVPNDSTPRWIPIVGGGVQTTGQGYVTQAIFGVKKSSSASFAFGAFIGVTSNSDAGPGREFIFDTGGNFSAPGTKSFRIAHPIPEMNATHELLHVAVEAPNADLIYRGTVDLVNGTATVNIDTVARMTDGTFVALTKDVQVFTSNETDWAAVRGSVTGNLLTIEAQDSNSIATISWMVIAKRNDSGIIETDTTDNNGELITERRVSD